MGNKELNKVLIILGPTASGKSEMAVKLAKKLDGEIISADSRQVYKGLDIGTGKVPRGKYQVSSIKYHELEKKRQENGYYYKGIRHHLIDVVNPDKDFTVVDYKRLAERAIKEILSRGKLPIICGGTGLYIRALTENLSIPKIKADSRLRQKLEAEIKKYGLARIAEKLKKLDPLSARTVDLKNPRRVVRALEVIINSGKSFFSQQKMKKPKYEFVEIGIKIPDKKLKENISKRVEKMFKQGLVEETRKIVQKYGKNIKALETIGYHEVIDFLEGKISESEAKEKIKTNTWYYAKRQMTWFKKDKEIKWTDQKSEVEKSIENLLNKN